MLRRMLSSVKESRYIPPVWLSVAISILFVYLGEYISQTSLYLLGRVLMKLSQVFDPIEGPLAITGFFANYSLFISLFSFFFIGIVVFIWIKLLEKRRFSSLGFYKNGAIKDLGKGFLIGASQFSFLVILLLVTGTGRLEWSQISFEAFLYIIALIPFWILQGGTEELVTRGWLFPMVSAKSNIFIGILISSSLFGALHLFNPGVTILSIVNIVLDGIFACFLMLKYDNMWVLAGMHGAWNFVQGNIFGILVSGQDASASLFNYHSQSSVGILSGGAFGTKGSIFATIVLIGCIAYLYWSLKKENRLPQALIFKK